MLLKLRILVPIRKDVSNHLPLSLNFRSLLLSFPKIAPNFDVRLFFVQSKPGAMSGNIGVDWWQDTILTLALIRAAALRLEMEVYRFSMNVLYCLDTSILWFKWGNWRVVLSFQIIFYPLSIFLKVEWVWAPITNSRVELALVHV